VTLGRFREIWLADFEFSAPPGEVPRPICLVAHELRSGKRLRLWEEELRRPDSPYPTGVDCLLVAYYASAELGCHLALGWPLPERVLDLYVEFRNLTNGIPLACGSGLVGALTYFGEPTLEASEKDSMRQLAQRGGPWTAEERGALLAYCESDVEALKRLLLRMESRLDLPRAILRGRYMKAAARMEARGVPLNVQRLATLKDHWNGIKGGLIRRIDSSFGVYDGTQFRAERFARWLSQRDIPWPFLPSGRLALDDDTFKDMSQVHPELQPLKELRASLGQMRLSDLSVGRDGRNRALLSAFRARTGRNQPSNSHFIFGPAVWVRGLIAPPGSHGLAYIDWSQQEFGIAAALSGDTAMQEAYLSGDPYLTFAKQAGAVPPDATKQTHGRERDLFKAAALAVQYGMGAESLGIRIARSRTEARDLLRAHRETYRQFWRWSDAAVDVAMVTGRLQTVFGWGIGGTDLVNARSLRNFPMQGNGAEMLRLACCYATERGIGLCAPVHDAVLIEAPLAQLDEAVQATQRAMERASEDVLSGFRLRSDVKKIPHPERFVDERGERMWEAVWAAVADLTAAHTPENPGAEADPSNLLLVSNSR
jgi:DNA polymerase I